MTLLNRILEFVVRNNADILIVAGLLSSAFAVMSLYVVIRFTRLSGYAEIVERALWLFFAGAFIAYVCFMGATGGYY